MKYWLIKFLKISFQSVFFSIGKPRGRPRKKVNLEEKKTRMARNSRLYRARNRKFIDTYEYK